MKTSTIVRKFVAGGVLLFLFPITNALAVSTFPTTGSCAMLVTQPVPVGATFPANDRGYNILAVVTFSGTSGTIKFAETRVDYTAGGPVVNSGSSGGGEGTFTVGSLPAPAPTEARQLSISITSPSPGTMTANAIAVNGGNTILIQGETEAFSGVCNF